MKLNKLESAIVRYEKARVLASELEEKRRTLVSECEHMKSSISDYDTIKGLTPPCSVVAFDYMINHNNGEPYEGDRITFDDAFFTYINDCKGACDKCLEAMKIKRNELAAARKEFGAAKRSISCHGKRLIAEHCRSLDDK